MAAALPRELEHEESYLTGGLRDWLTTVDHKKIAVMYGVTALVFFLVGGIEALVIRMQLMWPNGHVIGPEIYNQLFTMHGTTMIFLVIMPLGVSFFGNFLVPLQIGARDVAFPRLNALAYWLFLFGAIFLHVSFLLSAAPNDGWFAYANLTERAYSVGINIDFWIVGLLILGISSIIGALNLFVTVVNMRCPGMTFMRLPLFVWSVLVAFVLILVAFPPLTVALIFLLLDRWVGTHFFMPNAGGTPILWQHLFWLFGHPEVYILILPGFGIISEVVPTNSHKPLFGYPVMVYSTILIGFLSYSVWAHHMFATGQGPGSDSAFMLTSMLIAVPTGIKIFSWIATMWGGKLRLNTAMLFAIAFLVEFTMGGLSGIMHAAPPVDLQQTDSYFVVAHLHYVLFGGSMLGLYSGVYYWWPKITGRFLDEALGKLHFWLTIVGFNLTFFPMHFLGALGMPRRIWFYQSGLGFEGWNFAATIGAFILGLSVLALLVNIAVSIRNGARAENDPWDGRSLEWSINSPPPEYNFERIPVVRARDPFWVMKYGRAFEPLAPMIGEGSGASGAALAAQPADQIVVPPASYFPLLLALGVLMMALGAMVWLRVIVLGVLVTLLACIGMAFEHPAYAEEERHQPGIMPGLLDSRKVGVWTFIASESIFFASLIATYLIYKDKSINGPQPHQILSIYLTSIFTFVLLFSSVTMVLAHEAHGQGRARMAQVWLAATMLGGILFLLNEAHEFTEAWRQGLHLETNLFGQTFYTLVGFHGLHVTVGIIWLGVLLVASLSGKLSARRNLAIDCAALYWHFIDVAWVIIFMVVYLFEAGSRT